MTNKMLSGNKSQENLLSSKWAKERIGTFFKLF